MRLLTKDDLIRKIRVIHGKGWCRSVKKTRDIRNDGAVGNTLESLLGITENNLPIPNAREWELKGQRLRSGSLVTLKHSEPSPRAIKIVPKLLLPFYGWPHKEAGKKYPTNEMSFRSTTSGNTYTNRGFRVIVDGSSKKVRFVFDASQADRENPEISAWLATVERRVGLGPLNPEPYWGFADLEHEIGSKIKNCFYVIADTKIENKHEFFCYQELYILSGFSFERFLTCLASGEAFVDFDARTGHNHGTKFRIRQSSWPKLYADVQRAI
jgi:hypothetical protein